MKDKPVLMYVKNNILYPIALNKDQKQALDMFMHLMPGEMHYIKGNPIGEVMEVSSNVLMYETVKALIQKIDELQKENRMLTESCRNFSEVEENLHGKIKSLTEDNDNLRERILDLEACR